MNLFIDTIANTLFDHGFSPNVQHAAKLDAPRFSSVTKILEPHMGYIVEQGSLTIDGQASQAPWFIVTMVRAGNYGKACSDAVYAAQVIQQDLHASVLRVGNTVMVFQPQSNVVY